MERIKSCRVCRSQGIMEFLDLGEQPFANSLLKNLDEEERFYPLSLGWCPNCDLVQLNQTAEPTDLFSNYVWVTSTSQTALGFSEKLYSDILSHTRDLEKGYVLEVGSNDGTFLQPFVRNGYRVLGIDSAQNIVDIANANNVPTICRFFGAKAGEDVLNEYGPAQVIIARNILAHVANLHDFMEGISLCLHNEGVAVMEVHYAKRILEQLQYDSIYHEHLCYFTLKTIEKLLNQSNLFVYDLQIGPISGGALIVFARKHKTKELPSVQFCRNSEVKSKASDFNSWQDFTNRVQLHRERLLEILNNAVEEDGAVVGYGASARSSTLLNFCGVDTRYISMIADQSPLKHGHFTPGTHIPIDSPENVMKQNPKFVALLAWNFTDEIIEILRNRFNYEGTCIIPLPNNPRIQKIGG